MIYLPELYYLQCRNGGLPSQWAVRVTAVAISRWCTHFYAKIIVPKRGYEGPLERQGLLPADVREREAFVSDVLDWLFGNSEVENVFGLLLDDGAIRPGRVAKFDHHDDTCCWALNLTEKEFAQLQAVWRANGLPEDLFYPEQLQICVPVQGTGWKARLLRALGAQKCYSPKEWQAQHRATA